MGMNWIWWWWSSDKLTTMYTCISDYYAVHMMSNSRCCTMGDRPTFHAVPCMLLQSRKHSRTDESMTVDEIRSDKIHNTGRWYTEAYIVNFLMFLAVKNEWCVIPHLLLLNVLLPYSASTVLLVVTYAPSVPFYNVLFKLSQFWLGS
jgi:hypothetical protein